MVAADEMHLTSLRVILARISDECREWSEFMERFQLALSPALVCLADELECHRDIQSLDLLSQCLESLAVYIAGLTNVVTDDMRVDSRSALANIPLSELQYRLKGTPLPAEPTRVSGELDLF